MGSSELMTLLYCVAMKENIGDKLLELELDSRPVLERTPYCWIGLGTEISDDVTVCK